MDLSPYFELGLLNWPEVFVRVILAMFFGLVVGLDRDRKNKPMDFRAYMIVAVTSCLIAMVGQELYIHYAEAGDPLVLDLGKIFGGVLTGIGFLGAGAIIRLEDRVVGTATGASIWACGGIGLILGFGFYGLALIGFGAIALILIVGGVFRASFHEPDDCEPDIS